MLIIGAIYALVVVVIFMFGEAVFAAFIQLLARLFLSR